MEKKNNSRKINYALTENREGGYERRVSVYDWLRLIAIIYVVIGHSAYLKISTTYGGVAYVLPTDIHQLYNHPFFEWIRYISVWVYGFHMPLFFMLSGAVLALKPIGDMDSIIKRKTKRLLIPYFFYGCLFMLPVKWLGNFYSNESIIQALKGFLHGEDSGHLWFLTALFWCIIAFVIIKKALNKIGISSIYALFLVAGLIFFTYQYIPFNILELKTGLMYLIYFAIGFIFEKERQRYECWTIRRTIVAVVILIGIEIINRRFAILDTFFIIIIGSFLTFLISDIADRKLVRFTKTKAWAFITRNLFYVYIFHDPLNYIALRVFINNGLLSTGIGCVMYVVTRTLLIFLISLFIGEIVNKIKQRVCI